jgi:hypothetical protein
MSYNPMEPTEAEKPFRLNMHTHLAAEAKRLELEEALMVEAVAWAEAIVIDKALEGTI